MHLITPVILCGGSGTRLWPLSRAGFPKQFLVLSGTTSLFQQAVARINGLAADDIVVGEVLVVTGEEHRFLALEQLREMPEIAATLLLEPVGRNTAPALTFAALQAVRDGEDSILVVSPADQTVKNIPAFTQALQNSVRAASDGSIVILGIAPDKPETGYGYIKQQWDAGVYGERSVGKFAEKPDLTTAIDYLASGDYYWNGGMFVLRASVWLDALAKFRPDILEATVQSCSLLSADLSFVRPDKALFSAIPSESIDYAVMEHCPGSDFKIKMIVLDVGWNDLGSWEAVSQAGVSDSNGNVTTGNTILENTKNTFVHSSSRLVSTVGVDNLVIIETADAILITDKRQSQHVRKIVNQLIQNNRQESEVHRKVQRPWGWYDSIDEGDRFKVKRIQVKPGSSLSLQRHQHRAEHWVVVKGIAEVICGDKVTTLTENQSTYIPLGEMHRLTNHGTIPLEIIEVQSGDYLGEDDIERFEDTYGRS
jgi:mannose-1-phosphate guanylyltransferase/mannose-6-phosphate isomerase